MSVVKLFCETILNEFPRYTDYLAISSLFSSNYSNVHLTTEL